VARVSRRQFEITPELLLRAYRAGLFPMAESRQAERLYWLDPEQRGVIPLDRFHLPRRLLRTTLSGGFAVTANLAFGPVIAACAEPAEGREETWINPDIERLFGALHAMGHAHSIEVWDGPPEEGRLAGGLYGVSLGGAFFGESMFSRARDASKVALVHLVARLRLGGFTLLDAQFQTTHLAQFGCHEVPRQHYKRMLAAAVDLPATWIDAPDPARLEAEIRALRPPG
jgi:leucyl/phenylalanyl-tRNA--protein transferase